MADPACVVVDLLPSKPPPAVRAKPKTEAIEVIDLLDEDDVLDAPQCGSEQRLQIVEVVTKREEEKPELPQQAGNALVALAPTPTESEQRAKKKKNRRYTGTPSRKTSSLVCSTPCSAVESGLPMDRLVLVRKEGKGEPLKERAKRRKIRAPQRFTYDEFPGTGVRRGEQRDKSPQQGNGEEDKHDSPPTRLRDIFKTTKRTRRVDPKRKRTQSQEELKATATEVEVEQSTLEALRQSLESRRRVTAALREKLEVAEAVEARFCKKISDHELQLRKKNALLEDAKSRFSSEDDLNIDEDDEVDRNDDWCFVCEEGGKLICCATCEKSFHAECIDATEEEMKEDPWSCPTCVDSNLQWVEGKPSKKTKACSRSDERVINGEEREELVHKFRKDFLRIKDLAVVMSEIMKTQEHFNSLQTRHMIKRGQLIIRGRDIISEFDSGLSFSGKNGTGRNSKIPWFRAFDKTRSPTAQEGFYLVYLFSSDGASVFLSLNQGTTDMSGKAYVQKPQDELKRRVDNARTVLQLSESKKFQFDIDLPTDCALARAYCLGNIVAFKYDRAKLPTHPMLQKDFIALAKLLKRLYK